MLKQAIPPIVGGPHLDGPAAAGVPSFPPYNNLPQWTRVNTLAKSCPPRPLLRDRPSRQPDLTYNRLKDSSDTGDELFRPDVAIGGGKVIASWSADGDRRIIQLEHCITYLKEQHDELLSSLHQEVDKLKRENRDLQFKLTMAEDNWNVFGRGNGHLIANDIAVPTALNDHNDHVTQTPVANNNPVQTAADRPRSSRRAGSRVKADLERQVHKLESDILELRDVVREEKQRNALLEEQLDNAKSVRGSDALMSDGAGSDVTPKSALFVPRPPVQSKPVSGVERVRRSSFTGLAASQSDSRVPNFTSSELTAINMASSQPHPPTTIAECHELIQQLRIENNRQAFELNQLKSEIRDSMHSQKPVASRNAAFSKGLHSIEQTDVQQRYQHRSSLRLHAKKVPDALSSPHDMLSLPTVKLSLANKTMAVDRHRRTQQTLHRTRLDRELMSTHEVSEGL